jgi:two-component system, OmpR family, sensor histidine kinase PhoQ
VAGRIRLTVRFLLTTTLVLALSLAAVAALLERAYSAGLIASAEEQLQLLVFSLLGAADDAGTELSFPDDLPEPRLSQPESGLFALVMDESGAVIWRSISHQLTALPEDLGLGQLPARPGRFQFRERNGHYEMSYGVIWAEEQHERTYVFRVLVDKTPYQARLSTFRRHMTFGALAVIALLALVQYLAMLWGMRPVHAMANRILALERGERARMGSDHPQELLGLARSIDRFLDHEQQTRERYRRAMGDLAHSLKTPLAVLTNELREPARADRTLVADQLERMQNTISYQLSRPLATPRLVPGEAVAVAPLITRLTEALSKAYHDKSIVVTLDLDPAVAVHADERDLLEILGNLLDNAYKYGRGQVRVTLLAGNDHGMTLLVEDDGPGIPEGQRGLVLQRGARADSAQTGQGIGLAVVVDLLSSYRGGLAIEAAPLGGAAIRVVLP